MSGVRKALFHLSRSARPLATLAARPGYFALRDWGSISARRVAIVACHWIGDTFWATQVFPVLERRFPEAELFAVCKPATEDLWHGLLERTHVLPAPQVASDRLRERHPLLAIRRRARELRGIGFDLVIDLTGNRYSALFTWWLRPAASLGFDGGELGWLYSHRVADAERPGRHLSERPFRVVEPLLAGTGSVEAAIEEERRLLSAVLETADIVVDTSDLNVHDLRARVMELFGDPAGSGSTEVTVMSFGYKHGVPPDVDLVFDCRFLPNPYWVEELRPLTGLEPRIQDYVNSFELTAEFLDRLEDLLDLLLPAYLSEGKAVLTIAFGCTGGRHRSVAIAEQVAVWLRTRDVTPRIRHRDVGK